MLHLSKYNSLNLSFRTGAALLRSNLSPFYSLNTLQRRSMLISNVRTPGQTWCKIWSCPRLTAEFKNIELWTWVYAGVRWFDKKGPVSPPPPQTDWTTASRSTCWYYFTAVRKDRSISSKATARQPACAAGSEFRGRKWMLANVNWIRQKAEFCRWWWGREREMFLFHCSILRWVCFTMEGGWRVISQVAAFK